MVATPVLVPFNSTATDTFVTGEDDAATLASTLAHPAAVGLASPPVLKSASAEPSAFLTNTQPCGAAGTELDLLAILVALNPSCATASKHFSAVGNDWPSLQAPAGIAVNDRASTFVLLVG